ncbi:trypsin-like serine peptidase, partial [Desulfurivibrio sp. C05AmB]|uniref:trypsin-like serine peptidase n=1 Tax=Desulfurivibrio sp. C05AmB TaxID=3374371 RepID=UPI00376EEFAB
TAADLAGKLLWHELPGGGRVATIRVASAGAHGVRLGLLIEQVPDAAEFRFFGREGKTGHLVRGSAINGLIDLNLLAGTPENEARTYWSPLLEGDFIGLEIYLPPELPPESLQMALPALSHLFAAPKSSQLMLAPGGAGDCHLDISCFPEWEAEKKAVALMYFNIGPSLFQCTGTLLNDRDNSTTPYFLTANHCIDTQAKASSVQTLWFYYTAACDSEEINDYQFLGGESGRGAELLQPHPATDSSLLRLFAEPPGGVTFAGWSVAPPQLGEWVAGLHHPQNDLQKFSFGFLRRYFTCEISNDLLFCRETPDGSGEFVDVRFSEGTIEAGSSGSGIFADLGGYLLGTLSGGNASCVNLDGTNFYGRFDRAFVGAPFWPWLDPDQRFAEGLIQVEPLATEPGPGGDSEPTVPEVEEPAPLPPLDDAASDEPAVDDGNGENILPPASGGGGGCFIATAAYGSAEAPQVLLLRQVRDQILLRSQLGRRLVAFYYRHSPALAQWLVRHPEARVLVRTALVPVVAAARLALVLAEAREPERGEVKISLADRMAFC